MTNVRTFPNRPAADDDQRDEEPAVGFADATPDDATPFTAESVGVAPQPYLNAGDTNLPRLAGNVWRAINDHDQPPTTYLFGGQMMRLERPAPGEPSQLRLVGSHEFSHLLNNIGEWYSMKTTTIHGEIVTHRARAKVPKEVVEYMVHGPAESKRLPILKRLVTSPVFAADGSLVAESGYHAESGIYLDDTGAAPMSPISECPTVVEVAEAKRLIVDELFGDFPFATPSDNAQAVGLLLTPFVREMIPGPVPLFSVEKPVQGTGANLLTEMALLPALGRAPAMTTVPRAEDELRKKVYATLRAGATASVWDNLTRPLTSEVIASLLTADTFADRILGISEFVPVPVRAVFVCTANNPSFSQDIARRRVRIKLDTQAIDPLARTFRHDDLGGWAREHLGELRWAALTLCRAYLAAGRPAYTGYVMRSFEAWSKLVGGILEHAGIPGFLANWRELHATENNEGEAIEAFVREWHENFGFGFTKISQLLQKIEAVTDPIDSPWELNSAMAQGRLSQLGKMVQRDLMDRRFRLGNGTVVTVRRTPFYRGNRRWYLEYDGMTVLQPPDPAAGPNAQPTFEGRPFSEFMDSRCDSRL
jgi:hypothetical protein